LLNHDRLLYHFDLEEVAGRPCVAGAYLDFAGTGTIVRDGTSDQSGRTRNDNNAGGTTGMGRMR
jgi:hypothetical protein